MYLEQYDEAVDVAMRLDETIDEVFPPEHPAHAFVSLTCASGLKKIGRLAEASRYGQEAYDRFLASLGADRWETERSAHLNWELARDLNDADAIDQWGFRSIQTRLRVAGPGELESVTAHIERMESDLIDLGRADDAAGLIARVAAAAEDSVPSPHPRRARYLGNLGRAVVALERTEDAEALLLAAFDALPDSEASEEDRRAIGAALGDLYEARGNRGEAERWTRESGM
jgi:tetratricopeptide (TPR) repeat protein